MNIMLPRRTEKKTMRLDLFAKKDKVLLLGEGNFSFSVSLYKKNLPIQIFSTCFEKEVSYQGQEENIKFLKSRDVPILFHVDATKLHENSKFLDKKFNKVIFNFPHVGGKMKIHLNRKLLKEIFESCGVVVEEEGQVIVTLCGGQGGTPADSFQRPWADTWQITEMAAHGNFVLTSVEPFVEENFSEYRCNGFRGQDIKFNLKRALVHVFSKRKPLFEKVDEKLYENRLKNFKLNANSHVTTNIVFYELYKSNPFLKPNSCVSYLKDILIQSLKEDNRSIRILGDEEVPMCVKDSSETPCEVENVQNVCFLRTSPLQSLKEILQVTDHNTFSSDIIIYPGVYFNSKFSKNFLKNPPVSLKILIVGCDIRNRVKKYLANLIDLFGEGELVNDNEQEINNYNKSLGSNCNLILINRLFFRNKELERCIKCCDLHCFVWFGKKIDVCIIHIDLICDYFFKVVNWREIWAPETEVLIGEGGIPVLKRSVLYPNSYEFDITMRYTTKEGFCEEKFIETLWMACGMLIENIVLINDFTSDKEWSSKCYRITYKSLDTPLFRSRVIEIHSKLVGKMLEKNLDIIIK